MGEEEKEKIKILHVGNISLTATKDHVYTMFNYIGKITEFKIYPSESNLAPNINSRSAFIKYEDERCVEVGQHLTNVVLIDQAIVCIPYLQQTIPDEESYYKSGGIATAGQRQLPPHVLNKTADIGDGSTVLLTVDPTLEQLGLPQYPTLPGDTDLAKAEEIRRTVYVGNLPKGVKGETILEFFNMYVGEVMYLRMATGPETLPCAYAYIEFSQQSSVPIALQNNGIEFEGKPLRIQHSRVAIIKPLQKTDDQALEEIEEAIRQGKSGDDRDRRRSRSPIRRRRSPSPRRRSPVSSPRRDRRRSRSRDRKRSRSRDRDRERDRERERDRDRRKRSRSRDHRDRKRSRSRDRKRRSRSRDRKRNRSRDRSRSRDRKRDRKSSERKKDDKYSRKVEKSESIEELSLREKLLEKKAARRDERSSDSDWEEAGPKEKGDSSVRRNSDSE